MAADAIARQVPIAVVGAGAFMPGSADLDGFWRNVLTGRDQMTEVPASRWLVEDYYDPDPRAPDKTYGRRGAFLSGIDFDPVRYGIPPNALPAIDTSQLLALMMADRVIADCAAGWPADRERVSVLLGVSSLHLVVEASARLHRPVWLKVLREHGVPEPEAQSICDSIAAHFVPWQEETFPGLLTNVVAGRIANKFDLHGTNHTTDAACASSLAALYSAIAELSLLRSDLVITGGVDTMNDIIMYTCFSRTPALSPTGDCRPFSDAADGTMLGEGVAMLALKRLTDAERDGDRVYAVIRGVGTSSDGRGTAIYAPLPEGQVRALRRAYESAGYGPETVELVEAHGTGTRAGDSAEFAALRLVFGAAGRPDQQWCALGSVKSQIGHTKAAAGAAGLLKAVLSLHHKVLPPTIKVDRPNPSLELENSPFYLNTVARPWVHAGQDAGHPRRASVSSFGFGGSNFHVTLEEYTQAAGSAAGPARRLPIAPTELVLLSAGSPAELLTQGRQLDLGRALTDIARQSQQSFRPTDHARLAIVALNTDDLATKLAAAAKSIEAGDVLAVHGPVHYAAGPASTGQVGFLFPGQGAQYVGMGADLAMHVPRARMAWDRAAGLELGDIPLHRAVFPPPAFTSAGRADQEARLTETEWAQPALAVHSLALLEVLGRLGLAPDCVAGHSFGELVALHAAGAFDADTLVRLARKRGELMHGASAVAGAMLAVTATRDQTEAAVADMPDVWLANHNAPSQVVVAGTVPAVEAVASRLASEGITAVRLHAAMAFHSPLVASASEPLLEYLRGADVRAPALDAYAGRDGRVYPADPDEVRLGLAAQITAPVEFVEVIETMYSRGVRTLVEIGAGAALTGLAGQILGDREHAAISLDRSGQHGVTSLQKGLGRLAVRGVAMDFAALWDGCAQAGERPAENRAKATVPATATATVTIDGGNYGRPYPPAAGLASLPPPNTAVRAPEPPHQPAYGSGAGAGNGAAPSEPVPPVPVVPPAPAVPQEGWLGLIEDAQRQTAAAQADFQRTMTESHLAYLQMAETTFAGLLGVASGAAPAIPRPAVASPVPFAWPAALQAGSASLPPAASAGPPGLSSADGHVGPPPGEPAADLQEPQDQPGEQDQPEEMDAESLGAMLLSVVAERTGYPVEMLNVDMELDTDLGIDSIKKVEILSAVRERIGGMPSGDLSTLTTLRTLRAIAERVSQPTSAEQASQPTSAERVSQPTLAEQASQPTSAASPPPAQVARLVRWAVRTVVTPPSGLAMLGLTDGPVAVTDDESGIAALVVDRLAGHGIRADVVAQVPPDARGVILLDGLRRVASVDGALEVERAAFRAAREVAGRMAAEGGLFVTVQDTGGDFGLGSFSPAGAGAAGIDPTRAWLGGLAALAKTAAREWPRASVKAIDCAAASRPPAAVADAIVAELLTGGATITAGLRADGTRVTLDLADAPASPARPRIGPHSVVVATGGARGVTATALRLLARQHQPRLLLLGRTPLSAEPDGLSAATDEAALVRLLARRKNGALAEVAAEARRVLAVREIRETLSEIERSGASVRYAALDVRDAAALSETLAAARSDWGPITGVVHGAGVLADGLIAGKPDEQFGYVFDTKVEGLRALLAATADDPLDVLCAFSSAAAHFGNPGQSDYAMANEVLNQVLSAERARRPDCLVRAIGWGPWHGGMVTKERAGRFRGAGVPLIDPDAGAAAFVAELGTSAEEVRVILSAGPDAGPLAPAGGGPAAQVTVVEPAYGYLADHEIGGAPVVPVATVLDWFAGVARAWRPAANPVVIRDLRVLAKISLPRLADGGHRLVLRGHEATTQDGPVLDLDLRDEDGLPHYRASVTTGPAAASGSWEAPGNLVPLSRPYDGTTLFHGPRFQALTAAPGICPAGAEGTVVGSRALGWEGPSWQVDPVAVDGGLQLAVLWAQQAGAGRTLPMAVHECRVHRQGAVEAATRCVIRALRADDSTAACDVALIDPDGSPRVELLGVQLVRRPG
jgi:acyl transferase domain-containing protein/NADP-dependent 3-hydroxy acid dehydrogenase YdfG